MARTPELDPDSQGPIPPRLETKRVVVGIALAFEYLLTAFVLWILLSLSAASHHDPQGMMGAAGVFLLLLAAGLGAVLVATVVLTVAWIGYRHEQATRALRRYFALCAVAASLPLLLGLASYMAIHYLNSLSQLTISTHYLNSLSQLTISEAEMNREQVLRLLSNSGPIQLRLRSGEILDGWILEIDGAYVFESEALGESIPLPLEEVVAWTMDRAWEEQQWYPMPGSQ